MHVCTERNFLKFVHDLLPSVRTLACSSFRGYSHDKPYFRKLFLQISYKDPKLDMILILFWYSEYALEMYEKFFLLNYYDY